MKVDKKKFFFENWLEYTEENNIKYKMWRSLNEIRIWEEYIEKRYREDVKTFFNLQK